MDNSPMQLAFVGFGEAAEAFCSGLDRRQLQRVTAFDIKAHSDDAAIRNALNQRYQDSKVVGCSQLADALRHANLVLSLVTADQAHGVALAAAPLLCNGALFLDANSCAPQTKQRSAAVIDAGAGRYVDVAVMAPVRPSRHRTPLLVSGDHAADALVQLTALNMNASEQPGPIGRASSVKMVRSIMVKGLEALTAECLLAGRLAGVDDIVLDSLEASYPGFGWAERGAYNLERMLHHGERRAAEMTEVCHFLSELGIEQPLSEHTVAWQRRLGALHHTDIDDNDYRPTTDALIAELKLQPLMEN